MWLQCVTACVSAPMKRTCKPSLMARSRRGLAIAIGPIFCNSVVQKITESQGGRILDENQRQNPQNLYHQCGTACDSGTKNQTTAPSLMASSHLETEHRMGPVPWFFVVLEKAVTHWTDWSHEFSKKSKSKIFGRMFSMRDGLRPGKEEPADRNP